jgi:hypothetical protein
MRQADIIRIEARPGIYEEHAKLPAALEVRFAFQQIGFEG